MTTKSALPASANAAKPSAVTLANLQPIVGIDAIAVRVLEEMGLGPITASANTKQQSEWVDFSVLHFIILPQASAWLDVMLESDRKSTSTMFEMFGGSPNCSDADREDVLRETMNLLHGSLKVAFKDVGQDVIIPVVPQSIESHKISGVTGGCSLQCRYVLSGPGLMLRLTLIARVAPIIHKQLKALRLADVLVDPIGSGPTGEEQLTILKRHTMLNKRLLAKVRDMSGLDDEETTHAVIEPSVLAELLPND
jgi:hypothetical protein